MKGIFLVASILATHFCPIFGQDNSDEFDPVEGIRLADCLFHGDRTVVCTGRLRCDPNNVGDRGTPWQLDSICPREPLARFGTWAANQVIPAALMRGLGSTDRVARCQFFVKDSNGAFRCKNINIETWRGTYDGTINAAFGLGVSRSKRSASGEQFSHPTGSYGHATDSPYLANTGSARLALGYGRDSYDGGRYSAVLGMPDRVPVTSRPGNFRPDVWQLAPSNGDSVSQVTVCVYRSDGNGLCYDCSEHVLRVDSRRESRLSQSYNCSGEETSTAWTENSGFIPADERPDYGSSHRHVVATCVFRPTTNKFLCYRGTKYGSCGRPTYGGMSSASHGRTGIDSSCFTGDTWKGSYRGSPI